MLKINEISYERCLFAVKQGFKAIGGIENAKYLTGAEYQLMKDLKNRNKHNSKNVA